MNHGLTIGHADSAGVDDITENRRVVVRMPRLATSGATDLAISLLRMDLEGSYGGITVMALPDGNVMRIEIEFASMADAVHFAMSHDTSMQQWRQT